MKRVANYGYIREAFMVRRYHTMGQVHREEVVGHHTANVIAMLFFLFDDTPPIFLIRHALHHDVPELATGDVPATAKWRSAELVKALEVIEAGIIETYQLDDTKLEPLHRDLMKYADMMDLCFKSVEEMAVGNDCFGTVLFRGLVYVRGLLEGSLKDHRQAQALYLILLSNSFINIEEVYNGQELTAETKH